MNMESMFCNIMFSFVSILVALSIYLSTVDRDIFAGKIFRL